MKLPIKTLLKDTLEKLAEYEVYHLDFNDFVSSKQKSTIDGVCKGLTKKIYINTNQSHYDKIRSIIHEIRHACYVDREIKHTEVQIEKETDLYLINCMATKERLEVKSFDTSKF